MRPTTVATASMESSSGSASSVLPVPGPVTETPSPAKYARRSSRRSSSVRRSPRFGPSWTSFAPDA
jgi:hypothetical protein